MRYPNLLWPAIIALSAMVVSALVSNDVQSPLRPIATLWFLLICPGMAYVRLLRLTDIVAEIVLAMAISLVLALLVAAATLYAGLWSPQLILILLTWISLAGVICQLFLLLSSFGKGNVEEI